MRRAPQAAASRTRPNEELLGQVERALSAAGIDRSNWHDSLPQPPIRLPNSDYTKHTTHLYLRGIMLKQLAAFAYHLHATDPTLRLTSINLMSRHPDTPHYDLDLAISYLVYAP